MTDTPLTRAIRAVAKKESDPAVRRWLLKLAAGDAAKAKRRRRRTAPGKGGGRA